MNLQSVFTESKKHTLLVISCVLFAIAVPLDGSARVLQSVSIGLLGIYFLWNFKNQKLKNVFKDSFFCLICILFLIQLLSGIYTTDPLVWQRKVLLKLPMVLVPLFLFQSGLSYRLLVLTLQAFCVSVGVVALLSDINYFINYSEINKMVLQSKPIPIVGGTMHIYFSVMIASSIFFCRFLWSHFAQVGKKSASLFWACLLAINFLSLHLLAARTGLLAFYFTLLVGVLVYGINKKKYLRTIGILLSGVILSILMVTVIPSLKNRFENTMEDLNRYRKGDYIGYFSISARLETWKASVDLIKQKPLLGQGLGGVEKGLLYQYEINQSRLMGDDKLLSCHNQYLETAVANGIPSIFLLVAIIISSIKGVSEKTKFLNLVFIVVIASAFFVESLLERQAGVSLFVLFVSIFRNFKSE